MHVLAAIVETRQDAFEFARLPAGWRLLLGLLVVFGLCYVVFWMYRREGRAGAGPGLRVGLACLRCLVILLLATIWLQPVIARYTHRTVGARVAVLADVSASMSITDAFDESPGASPVTKQTRLERVATLLHADQDAWLKRFQKNNELAAYTFGAKTERIRLSWQDNAATPTSPEGATAQSQPAANEFTLPQDRTDLGEALTVVADEAGESPIAAVIVISDGAVNHGLSIDDLIAYAQRFKAPVYTVGVGSPREPPNLRVAHVAAPATTPKDDPFEVRVGLSAVGIEATTVEIELTEQSLEEPIAGGGTGPRSSARERVVAKRTVELGGDAPTAEVVFEIKPDRAGEFLYRARVAALPREAVVSDNVRETPVTVLDEKIRVLIVSGRPSFDYRYVSRLLERDKTIDVSCWLQSADAEAVRDGNTEILELPRRPEEVFEYDAILLFDPNPRGLDESWAVTVRRLLDEFGGGVLLQAGPHYTSRFLSDARLRDLVAVLPITPDPDAEVRLSEYGPYRTRAYGSHIPDEAVGHPLVALHGDPTTNGRIWAALPGIWWYLPVLREKPLASVLLRHGSGAVRGAARTVSESSALGRSRGRSGGPILMAAQPVGAGRTVFLGFENTWNWRARAERYFNRFWINTVRYLAQTRRQGVSKRGVITLDRESFRVGDFVKIEARVLDESFVPWQAPSIEAHLETTDEPPRKITLNAVPDREGWFAGRVSLDREGSAAIRVPLPTSPEAAATRPTPTSLVKRIRVRGSDLEMRTLRLHAENLKRLADETNGKFVLIAEAGELPDWIENRSEVKPPVRGKATELWDKPWALALLAALLAVEWTVRRRNHLL